MNSLCTSGDACGFGVTGLQGTCDDGLLCLPDVDGILSGDIGRCQRPPSPSFCVDDPNACPVGTACSFGFICLSTDTCLVDAVQSYAVDQAVLSTETATYFAEKAVDYLTTTALVSAEFNAQSAADAAQDLLNPFDGFEPGRVFTVSDDEVILETMRRIFSGDDFTRFTDFFRDSFTKGKMLAGDILSCLGGPDYGIDIGKRQLQAQLPEIKPVVYAGVQAEFEIPGIALQGLIGLGT